MHRKTTVRLLVVLTLTLSIAGTAAPARACASPFTYLSLSGFPAEVKNPPLYFAAEDAGATTFIIERGSHDCSFTSANVGYAVDHVTTGTEDLDPVSGRSGPLYDPEHDSRPSSQTITVPLKDDELAEAATEKALVQLRDPDNGVLGAPNAVPLYLVDDDGDSRVAFAETTYNHPEHLGRLDIPLFRAGDATSPATVSYVITAGPAPGGDPSQDLNNSPSGTISFDPGQRLRVLSLDVQVDGVSEGDENLTLTLSGDGLAEPSSTVVTIADDAPAEPPVTNFHHPVHGRRYPYGDFQLREVHVFATDTGSGVAKVHIALRRKLDNGVCKWWNGETFKRSGCKDLRWFGMKPGGNIGSQFYHLYRFPRLKPTAGTNIKNYTAYSRAVDTNGVRETHLEKGRNRNTFWIKARG